MLVYSCLCNVCIMKLCTFYFCWQHAKCWTSWWPTFFLLKSQIKLLCFNTRFIKMHEAILVYWCASILPKVYECLTEDYHALHHYYYHRAGTFVSIAAIGLHRQPDIWENPEVKQSISVCWQYAFPKEYDPLRFLPEKCEGRDSYAYMPFSAGPRYHNSKESECFYNLFL